MRTRRIIAATVAAAVVGAGVVVTPMVLAADTDDDGSDDGSGDGTADTTRPYGPPWAEEGGHPGRGWGVQDRRETLGKGQPGRGEGFGMHHGGGMGPGRGLDMGRGRGLGMGPGAGQHQRGDGDCLLQDGSAAGTLDRADEQALLAQVEHEKVARDVYVAFFEETGDPRFERIARSEEHHLEALRMLLDRYDLSDPTEGLDEGEFTTPANQEQYDAYVAQGGDLDGALAAARQIETEDIADLEAAVKALEDAPDVQRVYEQQIRASEHHLAAFSR